MCGGCCNVKLSVVCVLSEMLMNVVCDICRLLSMLLSYCV